MHLSPELTLLCVGLGVMTVLLVTFIVVTVRHHGWGQRRFARPAVKWFVAAMTVGLITLGGAVWWANS